MKKNKQKYNQIFKIILYLLALSVIATIPSFKGIPDGNDIGFHLSRIDGLKGAVTQLQIPARIYPVSLGAYGYASPLYYPDMFLLPAAALRILGFSMTVSYGVLLFIINFMTASCMYLCAKELGAGRSTCIISSALYLFSVYRIYNVYSRAALGETAAMIFFPLIIAGAYHIVYADRQKWPYLCIGMCGVLLSHIISFVICSLLLSVFFIVNIRRISKKERLVCLLRAAGVAMLLTCWFWVPFLYMNISYSVYANSTLVNVDSWNTSRSLTELFGLDTIFKFGLGGAYQVLRNVGFPFLLAVPLCAAAGICRHKGPKGKKILFFLAAGLLFVWMSSDLFPMELIVRGNTDHIFNSIQYMWRFLGYATPFLCLSLSFSLEFFSTEKKSVLRTLSVLSAAFLVFYGCYYLTDIILYRPILDEQTAAAEQFYRYPDYMPPGADSSAPWFLQGDTVVFSDDDYVMSFYDRDAGHLELSYSKEDGDSGYVDVARLYYPGYTARGADGKKLVIERSPERHTVRVILEKPEDTVSVEYKGIMLWHVAEAVSLIFSAFLAVKLFFQGKRLYYSSKKQIVQ